MVLKIFKIFLENVVFTRMCVIYSLLRNGNTPNNICVHQFVKFLQIIQNYTRNQQEITLLHYVI